MHCVLFQLNTDVHVDNVPKMSCDMPASTPDEVIISKMNVFCVISLILQLYSSVRQFTFNEDIM